jgi:hypothetical protein
MLCGTLTRSLRVAGAYRPNDFMVFRYQLLAIANECIQIALVSVIFTAALNARSWDENLIDR